MPNPETMVGLQREEKRDREEKEKGGREGKKYEKQRIHNLG